MTAKRVPQCRELAPLERRRCLRDRGHSGHHVCMYVSGDTETGVFAWATLTQAGESGLLPVERRP